MSFDGKWWHWLDWHCWAPSFGIDCVSFSLRQRSLRQGEKRGKDSGKFTIFVAHPVILCSWRLGSQLRLGFRWWLWLRSFCSCCLAACYACSWWWLSSSQSRWSKMNYILWCSMFELYVYTSIYVCGQYIRYTHINLYVLHDILLKNAKRDFERQD